MLADPALNERYAPTERRISGYEVQLLPHPNCTGVPWHGARAEPTPTPAPAPRRRLGVPRSRARAPAALIAADAPRESPVPEPTPTSGPRSGHAVLLSDVESVNVSSPGESAPGASIGEGLGPPPGAESAPEPKPVDARPWVGVYDGRATRVEVFAQEAPRPKRDHAGGCEARLRVRARNKMGASEWSDEVVAPM